MANKFFNWRQILDRLGIARKKNIFRKFSSRRRLQLETLESRRLLSINQPFLASNISTIIISGSELVDNVVVSEPTPGSIQVHYDSEGEAVKKTFDKANVNAILFRGYGGDDRFLNNTDVTSTAFGGSGDDQLTGGSASDFLQGGDGNDLLLGNSGNDRLYGNAGRDTLLGEAGDDLLSGGNGADNLQGGDGADLLYGEDGDDSLNGEEEDDQLFGGIGNDRLLGGEGNDFLFGAAGADLLYGEHGDDSLNGEEGDDQLFGGVGNDRLLGGGGNDFLFGTAGADLLYGKDGDDALYGGEGDDSLFGDTGDDQLAGGDGNDFLIGDAGADLLYGEDGADALYGGEGDDELFGNSGNDRLAGGVGNDYLQGDDGDDQLVGGSGNDRLYGNAGRDTLLGEAGDDLLFGGKDADNLQGGDGADLLYGEDGGDALNGEEGDDQLFGGDGNDRLAGGNGKDYLQGDMGDDQLLGDSGDDTLYGGDGDDSMFGNSGQDRLTGGSGDDYLQGDAGDDQLVGGSGSDRLYGSTGRDTLLGEGGDDLLFGGSEADNLQGGDGADLLYGEDGDDVLYGGEGDDSLFGDSGDDRLAGGGGNDFLIGAAGADSLYGEDGDDALYGGDSRDLLIGGEGSDSLIGEAGDDILIGGNIAPNQFAIDRLLEDWLGNSSYASRIQTIESDAITASLLFDASRFDDYAVDSVMGGSGADWFFLPGVLGTYDPAGNHGGDSDSDSMQGGRNHASTILTYPPVVEGFGLIDSLDDLKDIQANESLHTLIPHARDANKRLEHLSLFQLVRYDQVTDTAISNGNWSNPSTWQNGVVPKAGARVLVAFGVEVEVDRILPTEFATIRVDGKLSFATDVSTELRVDTMIVSGTGRLEIGTAAQPIDAGVQAHLVFTDNGPIDRVWDPFGISRGLITHGAVEMHGAKTASHSATALPLFAGATSAQLTAAPTGWHVGDQIVIAGSSDEQDESEVREILGVYGNVVTFAPLNYNHTTPLATQSVHIANLTRNIVLDSEGGAIQRRGHVMFMHNRDVHINYVAFEQLGRTNKMVQINDSVVDADWHLVAGTGTNNRARYAVHFHRNGVLADSPPAVVNGSVVNDNAGWGYVNHSSYVNFANNVAYNVSGAAYTTEVGDEIGLFKDNIAILTKGSGEGPESRLRVQDFGHGGDGFWFQGTGVSVVDNVSSGAAGSAFFYFSRGLSFHGQSVQFQAINLADPAIANGEDSIPSVDVPVREFRGNLGYASGIGLSVWYNLESALHGQQSVFQDSVFWNNQAGVELPYTNQALLKDLVIVGEGYQDRPLGVRSNAITKNITYKNLFVSGYYLGIDVAKRGSSVIDGGYFSARFAIFIRPGYQEHRKVVVQGNPVFAKLPAELVRNYPQKNVQLAFSVIPNHGSIEQLFTTDIVLLNYGPFHNQQVFFAAQAADAIPFPEPRPAVPSEYVGLTTQQLSDLYGRTIAGQIAPPGTSRLTEIGGLLAPGG